MEVPYGPHPLQNVKLFQFSPSHQNTLVLVHGGAWRDASNTFDDFITLVGYLTRSLKQTNIIGVNYRLSPEVTHPAHLEDLISSLQFLKEEYGVTRVLAAGHSVGATLLLQLLNYDSIMRNASGACPDLEVTLENLFFIDGIYDMVDLIQEYGSGYQEFVENAYGGKSHAEASQLTWLQARGFEVGCDKIFVLQSSEDELLSLRQSAKMVDFLAAQNVPFEYVEAPWGGHEEVYRRREVADIIATKINE